MSRSLDRATMTKILTRHRLVPVVEIQDAAAAPALGLALVAAGLPLAEITFRTAEAADAIRRLRDEVPSVVVGAGTVLSTEQVDRAMAAGATFLVAPGLNPAVVRHAQDRGAVIVPGVATATEIEAAMALGLDTLKFFPAHVSGGTAFLRSVASVYPTAQFMPTGGITAANVADYLALPNVVACGGSWMAPTALLADGAFAQIEALAREAVASVAGGLPPVAS